MPTVDSLDIQISAQAQSANRALDGLISRLSRVSSSLTGISGSGLVGLADGVSRLATSMQGMSNVKATDFNRLVKNIQKLNALNPAMLNNTANALSGLSQAFNGLGGVSQNAMQVGELASNLSKLGYKSISNATANMPALATALKNLMATLSTAPRVSRNLIDMTNALANLSRTGRSVGGAANSLTTFLNRFSTSANRASVSSRSLAAAIGRLYANFWLAIRAGRLLWKSIASTADYIEAYNYFNVAFGKIGSEWSGQWEQYGYENADAYAESFADRMSETLGKMSGLKIEVGADGTGLLTSSGIKNLGLNIQEMTQAASNIAAITNSVGQTGEVSLATAESLTALAGDMSSLFNVDYSTVMGNLQSGLIGQSRALYKYGIDITNATLQTYAYELGLSKAVSEMTQAEKQQLRLIAILDQSRVAWGDLANTINSPSNMIRQFKNNIAELGMTIGQLFMPILSKVIPVINGLTIALTRLMVTIAGFFGISLDLSGFGQGFSSLEEDIGGVSDGLEDVAGSAKKAKNGLRGFDELKTISLPSSGGGGGAGGGGGGLDLTEDILAASDEYMKAWEEAYAQMENKAEGFADKIGKSLEPVKKLFKDISIGDWFAVGRDVSTIVSGIFNFFARAIEKVNWKQLGKNIGDFLEGIDWTDILSSIGKFIWNGINAALGLWANSFSAAPIETALLTILALPGLVAFGTKISGFIVTPFIKSFNTLVSAFSGISGMLSTASALIVTPVGITVAALAALTAGLGYVYLTNEDVREGFGQAVAAIENGLQPAVQFFSKKVLPDLKAGWNKLLDILTPFGKFVEGAFTDAWQKILNPALTYTGETLLPKVTEVFSNLWNNVLVPLGSYIADVLGPVVEGLSWLLTELWQNVVVPLAEYMGVNFAAAFEQASNILNKVVIPAAEKVISVWQFLWTEVFSPLVNYLGETFGPVFEDVFSAIGGLIGDMKTVFSGLNDYISSVFQGGWRAAWDGVKQTFGEIFNQMVENAKGPLNNLLSLFENVANRIIDAFNWVKRGLNRITIAIPSWVPGYGGKNFGINLSMTDHVSIPRFEMGGFVEDGLFQMNDDEIIGKFSSNGKTAVANNNMIVSSIRQAAYEGFKQAMAENGGSSQVVFRVEGDPQGLFRVVKEEWNDEARRTQDNPVPIFI